MLDKSAYCHRLEARIILVPDDQCTHCKESVDQQASHGLSYKYSQGRHFHYGALNGIIYRALVSAKIPSRLEPSGMIRSDGTRPDGMSIIPWSVGGLFVWDTTCCDIFASSNIPVAVTDTGAVAAKAESN